MLPLLKYVLIGGSVDINFDVTTAVDCIEKRCQFPLRKDGRESQHTRFTNVAVSSALSKRNS